MAAPAYSPDFLAAVGAVLDDEGGYIDNRADRGGPTKFGISHRDYPTLDIKNLTRDAAIALYYRDFWIKFSLDLLPASISAKVFNVVVLMGPHSAILCLQQALQACGYAVSHDGVIGPQTAFAANDLNFKYHTASALDFPQPLLAAFRSEVAGQLRIRIALNSNFQQFARDWIGRAYQ